MGEGTHLKTWVRRETKARFAHLAHLAHLAHEPASASDDPGTLPSEPATAGSVSVPALFDRHAPNANFCIHRKGHDSKGVEHVRRAL
jgi:hypothetical protein